MSGNHDVLRYGRERADSADAQRSYMHPRGARQFEILGQAAGELNTLRGIIRIGETAGIAHFVEAFFVESRSSEFGLLPISGRDIGPSYSQFILAGAIDGGHL